MTIRYALFIFLLNISKIGEKTIAILAIAGILQITERVGILCNELHNFSYIHKIKLLSL